MKTHITFTIIIVLIVISCENKHEKYSMKEYTNDGELNHMSEVDVLSHFLEKQWFERFDADGVGLHEVLKRIENFLNERRFDGIPKIVVTTSTGEEYDPKIVIVLKNIRVSNLLDIISEQSKLAYRVDSNTGEIQFFNDSSKITSEYENSVESDPSILPPPGAEKW